MTINWLQYFSNERRNSVWYGGDIVEIDLGKYKAVIGAYGNVEAYIDGGYCCDKHNGGRFTEYLEDIAIFCDWDLGYAIAWNKVDFVEKNGYEIGFFDKETNKEIYHEILMDNLDEDDDFVWVENWLKEIID